MANSYEIRVLQEGPRNAIVSITGYLDSGDLTINPLITLSQFVNNDASSGTIKGLRIDYIEWSMSTGLEINLYWKGNTPQQIAPLAGRGKMTPKSYGGILPNLMNGGYDGSITMNTVGQSGGTFVTGQIANFFVHLEMVKLYN